MAEPTETPKEPPAEKTWRRGAPPGGGPIHPAHGGRIGTFPHVPTEEGRTLVRENGSIKGRTWCAIQLGVCPDTISNHYKPEMAFARAHACAQIGESLFQKALAGDGASQRFFLITQGSGEWSPKVKHEHTGPEGGPIRTLDITGFLEGKTDAELAILEQFLESLATSGGVLDDAGGAGFVEASEEPAPES